MAERNTIPMYLQNAVIERDKATCQYCGKIGTIIHRYGKRMVVEAVAPFDPDIRSDGQEFYNGPGVTPFEIDHIIPVVKGGLNLVDNLILSCRTCNRKKGGQ